MSKEWGSIRVTGGKDFVVFHHQILLDFYAKYSFVTTALKPYPLARNNEKGLWTSYIKVDTNDK